MNLITGSFIPQIQNNTVHIIHIGVYVNTSLIQYLICEQSSEAPSISTDSLKDKCMNSVELNLTWLGVVERIQTWL